MEDSARENNQEFINNSSPLSSFFNNNSIKYIIFGTLAVILINIIILDVIFVNSKESADSNLATTGKSQPAISPTLQPTPKNASNAAEAISEITATPTEDEATTTPTSSPTPTSANTSNPREYFIPLGQGSGTYTDWTVVPGIGAKIKISNYGEIDKTYFEATVRVPAGSQIVNVRLYNSSSSQSIANSELTLASNTSTLLISSPITLTQTQDENLYQVQLKTQLGATTYIDQARIRILSK